MKFDADNFVHKVNGSFLKNEHDQRYGQFLVNYLGEKHPSLYSQLPESADCFYVNSKCDEFLRWIYSMDGTPI